MLTLDFYGDYIASIKMTLSGLGYAPADDAEPQTVAFRYYNLFRRLVEPRPRKIEIAPALSSPSKHRPGFEEVQRKIRDGVDLRPHLSTRLADLDYDDSMLNDWGIHHLHLGMGVMANGFANRTGPLLFARFERDAAYLLAIAAHGAWTNTDFIECLHTNWPDVIASSRARGFSPDAITATQRANLRRKHANATVTTKDGTTYLPLGGGQMSSGVAMQVVVAADRARHTVLGWQEHRKCSPRPVRTTRG